MGRYLVIGGFEPSGHDTISDALMEAGRARGHAVESLRWREHFDIASHPMFNLHRDAARAGAAKVAGLLDEDWISQSLASELARSVPKGFDGYVSVHPWSSVICALALKDETGPFLIDYSAEYGAFPIVTHERISAHFGAGPARCLAPSIRKRCRSIGVSVPQRFHSQTPLLERSKALVVASGADGWASEAMLPALQILAKNLEPDEILLLAPSPESARFWRGIAPAKSQVIEGHHDISGFLKASRWYLSKGGGIAVAEGLAAGCNCFATGSGIFWEDEGLAYLLSRDILPPLRLTALGNCEFETSATREERDRCRSAGAMLWEAAEEQNFNQIDGNEQAVLSMLYQQVEGISGSPIPGTTRILRRRLQEWRDGWKRTP